jgi:hypothetical protein
VSPLTHANHAPHALTHTTDSAPTIQDVVALPPLDIDQHRQPGFGSAQIQGNTKALEKLCADLLGRMRRTVPTFPPALKALARTLFDEANMKFPACGQDVRDAILLAFFSTVGVVEVDEVMAEDTHTHTYTHSHTYTHTHTNTQTRRANVE